MNPKDFLELLILRFRVPPPMDRSDDNIKRFTTDYQTPIQLRVANTIKTWVSNYWYHFEEDPELKKTLIEFVRKDVKASLPALSTSLDQEIQLKHDAPPFIGDFPEPIVPKQLVSLDVAKVTDFSPLEVRFRNPRFTNLA